MNNISKEVLCLTSIASSIASDDLNRTDYLVEDYAKNGFSPDKLYETILQSYLFCGFPAAIESLRIFRSHFKHLNIKGSKYDINRFKTAGKVNCKLIYKKNYKKLIDNMKYLSPDLKDWMIIEGYGKVLGRKGLSLLERELINVSVLCTRFYKNQLHSHLKGCIHLGATKDLLSKLLHSLNDFIPEINRKGAEELIDKLKDIS